MAESDLKDSIREGASSPAKVSGDEGSVDARPVSEMIEADRYLASAKAVKTRRFGIRTAQIQFGEA